MNVFVLDENQRRSALAHHDQHVIKMTLETAQLLSTALSITGWGRPALKSAEGEEPVEYRPTHVNHPWTLWAAHSRAHWWWLFNQGALLREEYLHRFPKPCNGFEFPGMCREAYRSMFSSMNGAVRDLPGEETHEDAEADARRVRGFWLVRPPGDVAEMPQCMPEEHKRPTAVEAYRAYYVGQKIQPGTRTLTTAWGTQTDVYPRRWTNREPPAWIAEALLRRDLAA